MRSNGQYTVLGLDYVHFSQVRDYYTLSLLTAHKEIWILSRKTSSSIKYSRSRYPWTAESNAFIFSTNHSFFFLIILCFRMVFRSKNNEWLSLRPLAVEAQEFFFPNSRLLTCGGGWEVDKQDNRAHPHSWCSPRRQPKKLQRGSKPTLLHPWRCESLM